MIRIIETNIIMDDTKIKDHQSRIIEIEMTWQEYIDMFKNYNGEKTPYFSGKYGCLHGSSILSNREIQNFQSDRFHLSCDIIHNGMREVKLAYLIDEKYLDDNEFGYTSEEWRNISNEL